jgi:flagellar assembly protein FliH
VEVALKEAEAERWRREVALAYERGRAEGTESARREGTESLRAACAWVESQAKAIEEAKRNCLREVEREVVALVCQIVSKILAREVLVDARVAEGIVRELLCATSATAEIGIRVNPEAVARFRELTATFHGLVSEPARIRWIPDRRVPLSGAIVETESGAMDARVQTQLEEVAALFDEVLDGREA